MPPAPPPAQPVMFVSAYRQLAPSEKVFVDGYVKALEVEAQRTHERISNALSRPISPEVVEASRGMLNKPMVTVAITERINEIASETELTAQRIMRELMAIAFSSLADYGPIGQDGLPDIDLSKCTPAQLSALSQIEITTNRFGARSGKIKTHDKLAAINALAKFMGMDQAGSMAWMLYNDKPADTGSLPGNATHEVAADAYMRQINAS